VRREDEVATSGRDPLDPASIEPAKLGRDPRGVDRPSILAAITH